MQSGVKGENVILEVRNLSKFFRMGRHSVLKAVHDVSFSVRKGETLGLVGESGCGKTTCGRTSIGLYEKTSGSTLFNGKEIAQMKGKERKDLTKRVQMVFQDPYTSLDPKMKVHRLIAEGIRIHNTAANRNEEQEIVLDMLQKVGLHPSYAYRNIKEFSGGQRQRIGIARALAVQPEFLLCDEPISALDVSIQAQIMNLLMELQEKMGLTYLFIAHDLAVVKHFCDRIAVMYLGKIVEMGGSEEVYGHPLHPYTKALMSAVPIPDPDLEMGRKKILLSGESSSHMGEDRCRFADRCPYVSNQCRNEGPKMKEVAPGHWVACHQI